MTVFHDAQARAESILAKQGLRLTVHHDLTAVVAFIEGAGGTVNPAIRNAECKVACIVWDGERPIGSNAARLTESEDAAERGGLFVLPEYRDQGVGNLLAILVLARVFMLWDVEHVFSVVRSERAKRYGSSQPSARRILGEFNTDYTGKMEPLRFIHSTRQEAEADLRLWLDSGIDDDPLNPPARVE